MKTIKAFAINDTFISNVQGVVAPLFEISDFALTYSKDKQTYTYTNDTRYSLLAFKFENAQAITQEDADKIFSVLIAFNSYMTSNIIYDKNQAIQAFVSSFNITHPITQVTDFNYHLEVSYNNVKSSDSVYFVINGDLEVLLWMADFYFVNQYPDYDIDIVLPIDNLNTSTVDQIVTKLTNFSIIDFQKRIEAAKNKTICTVTTILNIPYRIPNTTIEKPFHVAFNIYGAHGNYEFILRLRLFDYLTITLGMTQDTVNELFPSLLDMNEFFIVPRWDKVAIPAHVGSVGINSTIQKTYTEVFDIDKFVKVTDDLNFLRNNTNSVPVTYNNLLLNVVNGKYSNEEDRDFTAIYSDIITIPTTHPDFSRMDTKTQHLIVMFSYALHLANANSAVDLLSNVYSNGSEDKYTIIRRNEIDYLSVMFQNHQFYFLPKYEYLRLI